MKQKPHVKSAEYISLLSLLHEVPTEPSKNNPTKSPPARTNVKYVLPFKKERTLTSTLGFLSSIEEDVNHIPAVCVAQEPDETGLAVFLAVNKRSADDGEQLLGKMKRGFEQVFATLSRELSNGRGYVLFHGYI